MGNIDQLIKKYPESPSGYRDVNPTTFTDAVKDRKTKETLEALISRNNFIYLPYIGSKESTRLQLDIKFRRKGLWIGYITYDKKIIVEFYNDDNIEDSYWKDDLYWLPYSEALNISLNEEDLTYTNRGIEFANRDTTQGMGRIIVRRGKPILEQFSQANTIYEICYDFDLGGKTLEVPANCVLDFKGGSFNNGTVIGNSTVIDASLTKIFGEDLIFDGNWNIKEVYAEWFGAKADNSTICTVEIQNAINVASKLNINKLVLMSGTYLIDNSITIPSNFELSGNVDTIKYYYYSDTNIRQTTDNNAIELTNGTQDKIINITIKNLRIVNGLYNYNNYGISIKSSLDTYGLTKSSFKNLYIDGFDIGFYILGKGFASISYNNLSEVACDYNNVGLCFESIGTDLNTTNWTNCNIFNHCYFNSNKHIGIYFKNISSADNNEFLNCNLENNGSQYNPDLYEIYGQAAIKMITHKGIGHNVFNNCYIESNFPRRTGTPKDFEYSVGSNVYPDDITTNAATVISNTDIIFNNCFLNNFALLGKINFRGSLQFNDNRYGTDFTNFTNDSHNIDYLFYFDIGKQYATEYSKFIFKESLLPNIYVVNKSHLFKFSSDSYENNTHKMTFDCDSVYGKFSINKNHYTTDVIYIGSDGNDFATGVCKSDKFKSFTPLLNLLKNKQITSNNLKIVLTSNTTFENTGGISLPDNCKIISYESVKPYIYINNPMVCSNIYIENVTFETNTSLPYVFNIIYPNVVLKVINTVVRFNANNQALANNYNNAKNICIYMQGAIRGPENTTLYVNPAGQTNIEYMKTTTYYVPDTFKFMPRS